MFPFFDPGALSRTFSLIAADIRAGEFTFDPEEIRSVIGQLGQIREEVAVTGTVAQGFVSAKMPASVNSFVTGVDSAWAHLATSSNSTGSPSLRQNLTDLHDVLSWLDSSLSTTFNAYTEADQNSASGINKAAATNGAATTQFAPPNASAPSASSTQSGPGVVG